MGIADHLTYLLRNLYAGQEATVKTGHRTTDWFQTGEKVHQGCILSPCLFNSYAQYIMQKAGLDEAEAGIKISGRNISNLGYADEASLWMKVKRNWRASWWRWKRKSEKADLNLNFHKRKSIASGPFTLWQTDRETMETVWDFIGLWNHCRWWLQPWN